jgi:hypothetical protein
MKKKMVLTRLFMVILGFAICLPVFADGEVSLEQFKRFKESTANNKISAAAMYAYYKENGVQFELDFANKVFVITGHVARIRKGFFDEYIVELEVRDSFIDISVVYPKTISQAKINDIAVLQKGDYFEAVVSGRQSYMYVDVLYYKLNGVTRMEL